MEEYLELINTSLPGKKSEINHQFMLCRIIIFYILAPVLPLDFPVFVYFLLLLCF